MYRDRTDAGKRLAALLLRYREQNALILALPRGGVEVGYEIAAALNAELDVLIVRKLGTPHNPELGFGAIASHGAYFLDNDMILAMGLSPKIIEKIECDERKELSRRDAVYRKGLPPLQIEGRTVILVDDGVATGGTARAAIRAVRNLQPVQLIFATPVAPPDAAKILQKEADEFVCPLMPAIFHSIGQWYEDFSQTSDETVLKLLRLQREHVSS